MLYPNDKTNVTEYNMDNDHILLLDLVKNRLLMSIYCGIFLDFCREKADFCN